MSTGLIGGFALAAAFAADVASNQPQNPSSTISKSAATAPGAPQAKADTKPAAPQTLKSKVKAALKKINPLRASRDKEYAQASVLFPSFCKDWERKLHDRETNNQKNIKWASKDGYQTGTYVGYGAVKSCESHQSPDGFAIGKLTYEEYDYYVTGKSPDDAQKAKPSVTSVTSTTELFRWDKGKWFY